MVHLKSSGKEVNLKKEDWNKKERRLFKMLYGIRFLHGHILLYLYYCYIKRYPSSNISQDSFKKVVLYHMSNDDGIYEFSTGELDKFNKNVDIAFKKGFKLKEILHV